MAKAAAPPAVGAPPFAVAAENAWAYDLPPAAAITKGRRKFQDPLWVPVFVLQAGAVMGLGIWIGWQQWSTGRLETLRFWPVLAAAAGWGWAYAIIFLILLYAIPYPLIFVAVWLGPVSTGIAAALTFVRGSYVIGILTAILFVLAVLWAIALTRRIPFAVVMIRRALLLSRQFASLYVAAFATICVYLVYDAAWTVGVSGTLSKTNTNYWWILTLAMLSLFWTSAVATNVVTVTVAGTIAAWFYANDAASAPLHAATAVHHPVARSLFRAITYHLGSIAFGSLLTALIQTLHWVVQQIRRNAGQAGEFAQVLLCVVECLIGFLESMVRFFNHYAYVEVAIYGKPYTLAARDTWELFHRRGMQALVQYDLTRSVLHLGALVGGVAASLAAGLWLNYTENGRYDDRAVVVAFAALPTAGLITGILFEVIGSIVTTLFVLYAEEPTRLQRLEPAFYQELQAAHHHRK